MSAADLALPAVTGIAMWAIGLAVIRFLPAGFDGGTAQVIAYALSLPTGWLTAETIARAARAVAGDPLRVGVHAAIIGLILNGVAMGFAPGLYGAAALGGAAWLFWMLAAILFFAARRR